MPQGPFLRKYGVQTTVDFQLFKTDGIDFKVDAAHASGDTTVMKDEGAEANTTNGFTDEGQGYSIVLTATEMEAARVVVYVVDQGTKAWLDTAIVIETYGHASAMHAMDFDDSVRGGLTALPNAAADAAGGLPISDAGGLDLDAKLAATNEITAARMGALTDWINGGRLDLILDDILADTNELQTDWANGGRLDLLIDAIKAVTDLLNAADSEPTGVPAANETPLVKLAYLFMALRNRVDVTATKKTFYDDGGAGEWEKDLSDDGTTYSESEGNAI